MFTVNDDVHLRDLRIQLERVRRQLQRVRDGRPGDGDALAREIAELEKAIAALEQKR